jgi:hypothetical protein
VGFPVIGKGIRSVVSATPDQTLRQRMMRSAGNCEGGYCVAGNWGWERWGEQMILNRAIVGDGWSRSNFPAKFVPL